MSDDPVRQPIMPTLCVFLGGVLVLSSPVAFFHKDFSWREALVLLGLGLMTIGGGLWLRRLLGDNDEPERVDRGMLIERLEVLHNQGHVDRETLERTRQALARGKD